MHARFCRGRLGERQDQCVFKRRAPKTKKRTWGEAAGGGAEELENLDPLGRPREKVDWGRIKGGNRAAHRGRPVVDALLCLTGLVRDDEVYIDLYGITPLAVKDMRDVPEVVEVVGFRASLHSEGKLTPFFQSLFERMMKIVLSYSSAVERMKAFKEDNILQQCHIGLQDCYDRIVAESKR